MSGKPRKREKTPGREAAPEALSFEDALERLEALVEQLEEGKISLEESLSAYVEGTRLVKHCQERLDHAETVIRELAESPEGFELTPSGLGRDTEDGDDEDDDEDEDEDEDEEDGAR